MEKTTLGLPKKMYAVMIFLSGILGVLPMLLVSGYTLLKESDEKLKVSAKRVFVIYVSTMLFAQMILLVPEFINILGDTVSLLKGSLNIPYISNICHIAADALALAKDAVLVILAFGAFRQKDFDLKLMKKVDENI